MTTTAPSAAPAPSTYRLSARRILRSEWHKLRTVRSTWITLLTATALVLGVGLIMGGTYESGGGDSDVDPVILVLYGNQLAMVCLAVLGILVTAGEYSTGTIRATLTAVPRRTPVLWAKAAVFTAAVLALSLATNLATFLAAQLLLSGTDQETALTDPGVLGAITGSAAGLTLLGLMALGLGALLRSVPGAIGAFVGGVLILPEILGALPYDVMKDVTDYFPTQALGVLGSSTPLPDAASPGPALLALALWAAAALTAAAARLRRQDV